MVLLWNAKPKQEGRVGGLLREFVIFPRFTEILCEQDKVNNADSAFIFLIMQSQNQRSGWSGQVGEDGLVWSGLC